MKYVAIPPWGPRIPPEGGISPQLGTSVPVQQLNRCVWLSMFWKNSATCRKNMAPFVSNMCFDVPLSRFALQSFHPLIRKFAHIYLFSQHSRSPDKYKISRLEVLVARFITLLFFRYTVDEERSGLLKPLAFVMLSLLYINFVSSVRCCRRCT